MSEKYSRIFTAREITYFDGAPLVIEAGALLKDNTTGRVIAQLKLHSTTNKIIKFAKVEINCLDSVGRPIGTIPFEYLDLMISRDQSFGTKIPIVIPNATTRSFTAKVVEVGFSDNSVWSNFEGEWKPLPEQRKIAERFSSRYASEGYRARFGTEAKYEVLSTGDIWLCCCGGINRKSEKRCLHCNASYDELILPLNEEELERDGIYATACAMAESMDVATVEAAIKNLGEIKDYKDAESLIEKCEARVAALKNAEAEAVAHKKKMSKLIALISGGVVALGLIGYFLIYPLVSLATGNYKIYIDMFNVEEFEVPDGETCIDPYEFADCFSLKSVVIGDSVKIIGEGAFYGCSYLESVVIGDGVTSIGWRAFAERHNLTNVVIGSSVKSIDSEAFKGCTSLTSITLPVGVKNIGEDAFSDCDSLTSIVLPDSVTTIGDGAFYDCDDLTSVTIGSGVTSISDSAFRCCYSLTSIVIPDSVKTIRDAAFRYCDSLTSIKYRGTQTQWKAITKGYDWDYYTGNYTITYNYTGD